MHMYAARKNVLQNREITLILKEEIFFATETSLERDDIWLVRFGRIRGSHLPLAEVETSEARS